MKNGNKKKFFYKIVNIQDFAAKFVNFGQLSNIKSQLSKCLRYNKNFKMMIKDACTSTISRVVTSR